MFFLKKQTDSCKISFKIPVFRTCTEFYCPDPFLCLPKPTKPSPLRRSPVASAAAATLVTVYNNSIPANSSFCSSLDLRFDLKSESPFQFASPLFNLCCAALNP